jgi:predicted tellurium resistance membrane protein TerC
MGLASLFVIVWMLMLGHGSVSFAGGFLLVMATTMLLSGLHDIWTKKRQGNHISESKEMSSSFSTKELPASRDVPAPSVTETTTRRLKVEARREIREDKLN